MEIQILNNKNEYWEKTIKLADNCSWRVGPNLAQKMRENYFNGWERVIVAIADSQVVAFCTFTETDYFPENRYSPWIGFVFVDEKYRGNRISEKMIKRVMEYATGLGFDNVYISTDHDNLYEKYGFKQIDFLVNYEGTKDKVLVHSTKV